jgi:hypothetical protein
MQPRGGTSARWKEATHVEEEANSVFFFRLFGQLLESTSK